MVGELGCGAHQPCGIDRIPLMSPEQKRRGRAIVQADKKDQCAVVEFLSRSYVQDFPDDAHIWVRRGRTLTMLCRYAEADAAFEAACQYANQDLMELVWTSKGQSLVRRGHFEEAEYCHQRAKRLNPSRTHIWIHLASATWMRGDLELAEARFRDALEVEDEEHLRDEALFNLGGVLVALGNLEEAAQCYREALEISPDYEIARFRLEDVERALELQRE